MANIASQKKRILRTERERVENRRLTSAVKTYFHRLETTAAEGDAEATAKLRKWREENTGEAERVAKRSWKLQEFLLVQGLS